MRLWKVSLCIEMLFLCDTLTVPCGDRIVVVAGGLMRPEQMRRRRAIGRYYYRSLARWANYLELGACFRGILQAIKAP